MCALTICRIRWAEAAASAAVAKLRSCGRPPARAAEARPEAATRRSTKRSFIAVGIGGCEWGVRHSAAAKSCRGVRPDHPDGASGRLLRPLCLPPCACGACPLSPPPSRGCLACRLHGPTPELPVPTIGLWAASSQARSQPCWCAAQRQRLCLLAGRSPRQRPATCTATWHVLVVAPALPSAWTVSGSVLMTLSLLVAPQQSQRAVYTCGDPVQATWPPEALLKQPGGVTTVAVAARQLWPASNATMHPTGWLTPPAGASVAALPLLVSGWPGQPGPQPL